MFIPTIGRIILSGAYHPKMERRVHISSCFGRDDWRYEDEDDDDDDDEDFCVDDVISGESGGGSACGDGLELEDTMFSDVKLSSVWVMSVVRYFNFCSSNFTN